MAKALNNKLPDITNFGAFMHGLCNDEIDAYLRMCAGKTHIKRIRKKFDEIAGINTMTSCVYKGELILLMYRHDVKRFANKLFNNITTYFD